ncbi:MAG TPA: hypothetical protein VJT49_14940 [Amycolatopsis sp.]|nr:hypothetical protein [Amycolatopsis sp.]HKS46375.1 hypothetical protein [Amycolatopsis sp.]
MIGEVRRLTRLLIGSWIVFWLLAILNGVAVTLHWYCGVCR